MQRATAHLVFERAHRFAPRSFSLEMMLSWQTTLLALADTADGENSRSARVRNEWSLRVYSGVWQCPYSADPLQNATGALPAVPVEGSPGVYAAAQMLLAAKQPARGSIPCGRVSTQKMFRPVREGRRTIADTDRRPCGGLRVAAMPVASARSVQQAAFPGQRPQEKPPAGFFRHLPTSERGDAPTP